MFRLEDLNPGQYVPIEHPMLQQRVAPELREMPLPVPSHSPEGAQSRRHPLGGRFFRVSLSGLTQPIRLHCREALWLTHPAGLFRRVACSDHASAAAGAPSCSARTAAGQPARSAPPWRSCAWAPEMSSTARAPAAGWSTAPRISRDAGWRVDGTLVEDGVRGSSYLALMLGSRCCITLSGCLSTYPYECCG
jgi:hypothetical protein